MDDGSFGEFFKIPTSRCFASFKISGRWIGMTKGVGKWHGYRMPEKNSWQEAFACCRLFEHSFGFGSLQ